MSEWVEKALHLLQQTIPVSRPAMQTQDILTQPAPQLLNRVEPMIAEQTKPVILYDYPVELPSLARKKASDPRFVERFELYVAGLELGNAFSELTYLKEQKERLLADLALRRKLGKKAFPIDQEFIEALEAGLPPTAGMAIGVDRLVMLLADTAQISDTLFFPLAV